MILFCLTNVRIYVSSSYITIGASVGLSLAQLKDCSYVW